MELGGILLVEAGDLDFIVEHSCSRNGLRLRRTQSAEEAVHRDAEVENYFLLFGECTANCVYLSKILSEARAARGG